MGMVGNARDAEIASRAFDVKCEQCSLRGFCYRPSNHTPEGWDFLGHGAYRACFLSPEGVVYKICRDGENSWSNDREYENLIHGLSCKAPEGTRMPRFTAYETINSKCIIAMEKVRGELAKYANEPTFARARAIEATYGLLDLHGGNMIVEEGTRDLVIIDWGG